MLRYFASRVPDVFNGRDMAMFTWPPIVAQVIRNAPRLLRTGARRFTSRGFWARCGRLSRISNA